MNKYPLNYNLTSNGLEMAVDEELSDKSSNPVANYVLKKAIEAGGGGGGAGKDGRGIVSITKTGTSGLVDTYTVKYTDNTTSTFTVTNGKDGADGKDGTNGKDGADGKDGEKG